jgi:CDP-diacylglycerol--glycerol-3-phosphate 3-phosphatidyltransferase
VSFGAALAVSQGYLLLGGLVLLFSGVFDLLDGPLARAKGTTTKFGAFLDSSVDRLSEAALLLGLLLYYHWEDSSSAELALVFGTLVGSLMVSYMRARAEGLGVSCDVGIFTRPERVVVLAAGLVLGQFWEPGLVISLGIIAAFAWITVFHRLIHVRAQADQ